MYHLLNKSLQGRKQERESASSSVTAMLINKLNLPSFPQFEQFDDNIRKLILSYVAEAHYENRLCVYQQGELTYSLPLVSKEFNQWSTLDYFWEPTLKRQVAHKNHGILWREGLRRLLPLNHEMTHIDNGKPLDFEETIQEIKSHSDEDLDYRKIYKKVLTNHIHFEAPVFGMSYPIKIGEIYGLHLFEPRYRIMVRDLIVACANPVEAAMGGKIRINMRDGVRQPPMFIHACYGSNPGDLACLVQLIWCQIYEDGAADVRLLPISWVRLDRIWIRRHSRNLFYSSAWRLPPSAVQSFGS